MANSWSPHKINTLRDGCRGAVDCWTICATYFLWKCKHRLINISIQIGLHVLECHELGQAKTTMGWVHLGIHVFRLDPVVIRRWQRTSFQAPRWPGEPGDPVGVKKKHVEPLGGEAARLHQSWWLPLCHWTRFLTDAVRDAVGCHQSQRTSQQGTWHCQTTSCHWVCAQIQTIY